RPCRRTTPRSGSSTAGDVPDRDGLLRLGSAQAVEYVVECRRVERTINRQGLHHVRLDGGWVHRRKPAAGAGKHVRVRIEQGDLRPGRQPGVPDEVAGAGADIEMSASKVLAMALDDRRGGAPPDHTGHEAEHERVIDREEERVVTSLAPVRRIVAIHLPLALPGDNPMTARETIGRRGIDPWSSAAPTGSAVKGSAHAIGSRSDPAGARPVTLVP